MPVLILGTGLEFTKGNERLQDELKGYGKTTKCYGMFGVSGCDFLSRT